MGFAKRKPHTPQWYLIKTNSGFWGVREEGTGNQRIISHSRRETEAELDRLNKPEAKLPYQKSVIEEILAQEKTEARAANPEPRQYSPSTIGPDILLEPEIAKVFSPGITVFDGGYWLDCQPYSPREKLEAITGPTKAAVKILRLAWSTGLLPLARRRKKPEIA